MGTVASIFTGGIGYVYNKVYGGVAWSGTSFLAGASAGPSFGWPFA